MVYQKQNFQPYQTLKASHLNHMEDGIAEAVEAASGADSAAEKAEAAAKRIVDMQLSASGLAVDTSKLGGKEPEYYIQPRNLLDNSNFTNLVNQRAATSYTGNGSKTPAIDRWVTWGAGTLTVNDGYITVSGSDFVQYIDAKDMDLTKPHSAFACTTSGEILNIFHRYEDQTGVYMVSLPAGYDFLWTVLYEGEFTAETLPPYVPKGYAAELSECQRYYENSWFGLSKNEPLQTIALAWAANSCEGEFRFSTEKRTVPTMTAYPSAGRETVSVYIQSYQPVQSVTWLMRSGLKGAWLRATMGSNMLTIGNTYGLHAHWEASADL